MPVQRKSQSFKDISMTFQRSPLSSDLIAIKNQTAIARSLRNLVLTVPGERFFNEDIGSNVNNLLFEPFGPSTASEIEDEIKSTIENFEPRVELINLVVEANSDSYEFDVTITYKIIGIEPVGQQLSFALQPAR